MPIAAPAKSVYSVIKAVVADFLADECLRLAAALAYYTLFSLPPLLVIVITVAGALWGREAAEGRVKEEMRDVIGEQGAAQVQTMLQHAGASLEGNRWATALGIGALLFGATGAFAQIQRALNIIWGVEPDPKFGGVRNFLLKRLLSFGMTLCIAFLLLVALVISSILGAVGAQTENLFSESVSTTLLRTLNFVISLGIITFLFAAIFKVLPDADVTWRDVWVGAAFTSTLFVIGKWGIGLYLGNSNIASAYGAAGSLAIVLIWAYFTGVILFAGAEFTQVWARQYGTRIVPSEGAVRVVQEVKHVDEGGNEVVATEQRKDKPVP